MLPRCCLAPALSRARRWRTHAWKRQMHRPGPVPSKTTADQHGAESRIGEKRIPFLSRTKPATRCHPKCERTRDNARSCAFTCRITLARGSSKSEITLTPAPSDYSLRPRYIVRTRSRCSCVAMTARHRYTCVYLRCSRDGIHLFPVNRFRNCTQRNGKSGNTRVRSSWFK